MLELARRVVGNVFVILGIVMLLFGVYGHLMPGDGTNETGLLDVENDAVSCQTLQRSATHSTHFQLDALTFR